jgi:hypothetical protein
MCAFTLLALRGAKTFYSKRVKDVKALLQTRIAATVTDSLCVRMKS